MPPLPESDHTARILDDWAREQPELDTSPIASIGRVLRAARYFEREIELELRRFDLSVHEFNALCALRRIGPPHRLTPTALADALLFTSGGLTKLLERLERAGLVSRERDEADRRVLLVCLTDAGRARQAEAMGAHLRNEEELLAPLAGEEREQLAELLRPLLVAFESAAGRARPRSRRAPLREEAA